MEIVPVKYLLSSLVNDTVNIIRTRLKEKPIRFYTNIDGNIPNILIGDEVRLRQILINLLSNAVKFTDRGHISLTITVQGCSENTVWLDFTITDTGKGIKLDDQKKLFSEFVQVDLKRNRNVEGTGLGLAVTKKLCLIMNGDIQMKSEFGKGSTFTVTVPQGIETSEPFAVVDNAEDKKVLVFEGRLIYAKSVCWSLRNMGVAHTMVTNIEDFTSALFKDEWSLVLSGYGIHDKVKKTMDKPDSYYAGGKKPPLALMVEWGTESYISDVRFVSLPVQSLSIANILNNKEDDRIYSGMLSLSRVIRHAFPGANILVVDDIQTNIKVTEGLLAPYRAKVDSCLSGAEAIELVKRNEYDLVFMDHMMPEMDGIEATCHVRDWEKERTSGSRLPIVALTANAVSGAREMFLEKGFDDFLAKPVDISALDDILNRWISKDKREQGVEINTSSNRAPRIKGVDVQKGIRMTGGTEEGYSLVLSTFRKDIQVRLKHIRSTLNEDTLSSFITHVHALKGASGAIGAADISTQAARLENAGKEDDRDFINGNLERFIEHLCELNESIGIALEAEKSGNNDISKTSGKDELVPLLQSLKTAIQSQKAENIDRILGEIGKLTLDEKTSEAMDKISDDVLMTEFDNVIKTIDDILNDKN
jgi:CheY-like chemotaxis protein